MIGLSGVTAGALANVPLFLGDYAPRPGEVGVVFPQYRIGDVRRYGGVGNGVHDDRAAFQRAHDNIVALGGGVVIVPRPVVAWVLGGTVNCTAADVAWQGDGASLVKSSGVGFHLFTLTIDAHRASFREMRFQGSAVDGSTSQFALFTGSFAAPDDVVVDSCAFGALDPASPSLNNGVKIDGGARWRVTGNVFENLYGITTGAGYGVLCGTTTRLIAAHNQYVGAAGRGRHAIYLSGGCTFCQVGPGNIVSGTAEDAFPVFSQGAEAVNSDNVHIGNIVNGGGSLTSLSGAISYVGGCSRNRATGNSIRGFNAFGIVVATANNVLPLDANVVDNNDIRDVAWDGVAVYGASNTVIAKNNIADVAQASPGGFSAISLRLDDNLLAASGTHIIGNRHDPGTTARTGVFAEAGVTGTLLNDNRFPVGVVDAIELNGNVAAGRGNDFGLLAMSPDNGDQSITFQVARDSEIGLFATNLTANRVVTLSAVNAFNGAHFRIVRTGTGAFTLDVGGLKVIPAGVAAWVDVVYQGGWHLAGYGAF